VRITHGSRDTFPCPANRRFWLSSYVVHASTTLSSHRSPPDLTVSTYLPTDANATRTRAVPRRKRDHPCVCMKWNRRNFLARFSRDRRNQLAEWKLLLTERFGVLSGFRSVLSKAMLTTDFVTSTFERSGSYLYLRFCWRS